MFLKEIIEKILLELQDEDNATYSEDDVNTAMETTLSLMSRLIPDKGIVELEIGETDIDDEALTIASNTGTLEHYPVKFDSETITDGSGNEKTRNDDYTINYLTGVITEVGSNLADGAYTVDYELDPQILNISSNIPDCIRIERVEYPADRSPMELPAYEIVGDYMRIKDDVYLAEDTLLRIEYIKRFLAPTLEAEGNYPSHLNSAIVAGSCGNALINKARAYIYKAATAVDTAVAQSDEGDSSIVKAKTALGNIPARLEAAVSLMATGGDLINAVNAGDDVGNTYVAFAKAQIAVGAGYADEATNWLNAATAHLNRAEKERTNAPDYLAVAEALLRAGSDKLNEFYTMVGLRVETGYTSASRSSAAKRN